MIAYLLLCADLIMRSTWKFSCWITIFLEINKKSIDKTKLYFVTMFRNLLHKKLVKTLTYVITIFPKKSRRFWRFWRSVRFGRSKSSRSLSSLTCWTTKKNSSKHWCDHCFSQEAWKVQEVLEIRQSLEV